MAEIIKTINIVTTIMTMRGTLGVYINLMAFRSMVYIKAKGWGKIVYIQLSTTFKTTSLNFDLMAWKFGGEYASYDVFHV